MKSGGWVFLAWNYSSQVLHLNVVFGIFVAQVSVWNFTLYQLISWLMGAWDSIWKKLKFMEDFKLEGGIFHIFLYFTIVKHSFSQNVFFIIFLYF